MLKGKKVLSLILTVALVMGISMGNTLESRAEAINIALNKTASASSYQGGNTPGAAFDGNAGSRWESASSDPQWISVDLGGSRSITGVKLVWETAAAKDYKIQVSSDGTVWNDAYTKTGGTGGTESITFSSPATGRYVRMYGTARTTGYGYSLWEFEVYDGTQSGNLALNRTGTASSYLGGNIPSAAFDGNVNSRWESAFSDPQWLSVDLGASYSLTGVKIIWEAAAARDYKIQVSADGAAWNDAYTKTGGTGGTENITFASPVTGRYVRMYGTARTTGYGYSIWEMEVYGATSANKVLAPAISPATGTYSGAQTVTISDGTAGATIRYTTDGTTPTATTGSIYASSFTVSGTTTVKAMAYKSGMTNSDVATSVITISGGNNPTAPNLGPNVKIFDPSMSAADIQNTCNTIFNQMQSNQFGSERYALLFKPGSYNLNVNVGFYTSVYGLGQRPDDVTITGSVRCEADWMQGNATCNFWRSAENYSVAPTYSASPVAPSGMETWAASQAAPMRRVHIKGSLTLWDPNPQNYDGSWSSGGFIADSLVDGQIVSGSQQQYLTRNVRMGSWSGANWNMVFVGDQGGPGSSYPNPPYTVVGQTPVVREKPFLYIDGTGKYSVFVPAVRTNSQGITWANGMGTGTSLPIEQFVIAYPGTSTAASLNQALADGKNILFTPGIYHLSEALRVTRADTVILGLGLATLTPDNGTVAMTVADVDGVKIAGLFFDAGANNSPVLLEVGPTGSSQSHSANPTTLSDLFFRVGGAAVGKADLCLKINSNNVIGDHFWVWRADHGAGVGWDVNTTKNGMIVNGSNVTIYGLFVEHFHEYQTVWNGNGGRVYFYQSEIPYDVPSQARWMNGSVNGYASYKVANSVTSHEVWGSGIYSFFRDAPVKLNSAVETPVTSGVRHHNTCTIWLAGNAASEITHIINNTGNAAVQGAGMRQTLAEFP